jgi:hypothetical protein
MKYRLDDVIIVDSCEDENIEVINETHCVKTMFYKVFESLKDINGLSLKNRVKFKDSYNNLLEKCTLDNSMELIYKLLNKHILPQESSYYKDEQESMPSNDVLKVIELLNYLHQLKIPKKFVGGFLLLTVKFVYFPLPVV